MSTWVHTHDVVWGSRYPVMLVPAGGVTLCYRSDGLIEWVQNRQGKLTRRGAVVATATLASLKGPDADVPQELAEATFGVLPASPEPPVETTGEVVLAKEPPHAQEPEPCWCEACNAWRRVHGVYT